MTDETRGQAIKRRRLALGINSMRRFAQATGRDRETLAAAEADAETTLDSTFDSIEAWLTRAEAESGVVDDGPLVSDIRVEIRGEVVTIIGPMDQPDAVAEATALIMERLRSLET